MSSPSKEKLALGFSRAEVRHAKSLEALGHAALYIAHGL